MVLQLSEPVDFEELTLKTLIAVIFHKGIGAMFLHGKLEILDFLIEILGWGV